MSNEFDKIYEQAKNFTEIMEIKTEKVANIFIETLLSEKRKYKKKKMFDELSNDEIAGYDCLKLYRVQVYRVIFDLLSMTIENRFLKN